MTSPHTIDYLVAEYKRLNASYEQLSGKKITDEALRQSIALYNTQRRLVRELYAIRRETPQNLSTVECYVLTRIGTLLPPEEHIAILEEAIPDVRQRNEKPKDRIRVVLEGSFCEQPPIELLDGLEAAGCYILDDDFLIGWRWFSEDIPTDGDPLRNLANAYLNQQRLFRRETRHARAQIQTSDRQIQGHRRRRGVDPRRQILRARAVRLRAL